MTGEVAGAGGDAPATTGESAETWPSSDPGGGRAPRAPRRGLTLAVVVVVALFGAAAVVAVQQAGSGGSGVATDPVIAAVGSPGPAGPDAWLVPTWVPEGLDVWNVEWREGFDPGGSTTPPPWMSLQLFGDPDAGRALHVQAEGLADANRTSNDRRITVRGHRGWAGRNGEDDVDGGEVFDAIEWHEGGATVNVRFKGMDTEEAIRAVEAMAWRTGDPRGGFAPPADGSLPLRGEVLDEQLRRSRRAEVHYSEGPPYPWYTEDDIGQRGLVVEVSTVPGPSAEYLDQWFSRGDEAPAGPDGSRHTFDEGKRVWIGWPDGSEVTLRAPPNTPVNALPDRESLARVADSVVMGTEADLAALHDRFEANIEALPLRASAGTSAGTLELRGESGGYQRLCLRPPNGAGLECGEMARYQTDSGPPMTSWVVDGVWLVGFVGAFEPEVTSTPGSDPLARESVTVGDFHFVLVRPPPAADAVRISEDPHHIYASTILRPISATHH